MRKFFFAAAAALGMVGCLSSDATDHGDEPLTAGAIGRNTDITTVVVWSQNMRQGLDHWQYIVRCMGDPACNSLGAIPDIVLLQEASCDNVAALQLQMDSSRSAGGLGITGWKHYCVENPNSGGVTGHWLSNGIIYRKDRFQLESDANALALGFYTGDGITCSKAGRELPVIKLLDLPRRAAGLAETHITLAVRHDDHFGDGGKHTCDDPASTTRFCDWPNSKLIDAAIDQLGGGLDIMAGDWNYAAKHCEFNGAASNSWKHDYACTTKGLTPTCDNGSTPNLGWRDPILESDPTVYDAMTSIDFIHVMDAGSAVVLNHTARNSTPGIVGACFYCDTVSAYTADESHPNRMTDHSARFMRLHY
jgi:hypothetical protein